MSFDVDATKLFKSYAAMKGLPIEKVVRNAARDYVFAAQKTTPVAKMKGFVWTSFINPQTKRKVFVRGTDFTDVAKAAKRLKPYDFKKHYINKGWSKATWFGAWPILELEPKGRNSKRLAPALKCFEASKQNTLDKTSITLVDYIRFDRLPGMIDVINFAGMEKASTVLVRGFMRALKQAWRDGTVPDELKH